MEAKNIVFQKDAFVKKKGSEIDTNIIAQLVREETLAKQQLISELEAKAHDEIPQMPRYFRDYQGRHYNKLHEYIHKWFEKTIKRFPGSEHNCIVLEKRLNLVFTTISFEGKESSELLEELFVKRTLKRLVKGLLQGTNRKPERWTLDAIALFLGYEKGYESLEEEVHRTQRT